MVGVVGPGAAGEDVQNGFHNLIGDTPNRGWRTQLSNEPLFEVTPERTWRVPLGSYHGVSFEALPNFKFGFGLERNYVQAGVILRMGQGLDSDYGVARINPGFSGTDAYTPTRPFVWYVFGGRGRAGGRHGRDADGQQLPKQPARRHKMGRRRDGARARQ